MRSLFKPRHHVTVVIALSLIIATTVQPTHAQPRSTITWEDCPAEVTAPGAQCGRLGVPMDYTQPNAKDISVGLVKLPAQDQSKRKGTLFSNPGGPGVSVYDLFDEGSDLAMDWPDQIRQDWDIVAVQPRGLVGSTPLECELSLNLAPEQLTNFGGSTQAKCDEKQLGYAANVNTENTADDWEQVRLALEEEAISLYGMSYGTFLASTYATKYPQHTDKVILDSGYNMDADASEQLQGHADAFDDFFTWVAKYDDVYHMGNTPRAVYKEWAQRIVSESGTSPTIKPPASQPDDLPNLLKSTGQFGAEVMTTTDEATVDMQGLAHQIRSFGANQSTSQSLLLTQAYVPMPKKWPWLAATLASEEPTQLPDWLMKLQENNSPMLLLVQCNDQTPPLHYGHLLAGLWAQTVTGDPLGSLHLMASGVGCTGITPSRPIRQFSGAELATKPLQIQATRDPKTPYWNFEKMSTAMQSHVVTVNGPGHVQGGTGNVALNKVIAEYLDTGTTTTTTVPGIDPLPNS